MAYERVNYTTVQGKQSAAYWDAQTQESWDVFTRQPVAILQDPVTHLFSEWVPRKAIEQVGNEPVRQRRERPRAVSVYPIISPFMIIPAGLFGIACIWLELTFAR